MSNKKPKQQEESLQDKIDEFNLFLEELESEWVDETVETKLVEEPVVVEKPDVKPKSEVVLEKQKIPKPRPQDPSTEEIHVDLETGEVTFDDLQDLEDFEDQEIGQEVLDELLDADVSETIEIEEVKAQVATIKTSVEPIEIHDEEEELEEEEEDEIFFGRVEKPKKPEQFAHNYLFARFPVNFMLILVPQAVGILVGVLVDPSFEFTAKPSEDLENGGYSSPDVVQYQNDAIDRYLLAVKLSLVILLAFFLCYRWSTMQNNGSYGYWLTQGVNRRKFFIETIYKFLFVIYFGIFIGLMSLIYLIGIYLDFSTFILLNLLILSHVLLVISVGITIGVFTKNPETAALLFIIGSAINNAFNREPSFWNRLLQSDLQYRADTGDAWFSLIISVALGLSLAFISLKVHLGLDMEL